MVGCGAEWQLSAGIMGDVPCSRVRFDSSGASANQGGKDLNTQRQSFTWGMKSKQHKRFLTNEEQGSRRELLPQYLRRQTVFLPLMSWLAAGEERSQVSRWREIASTSKHSGGKTGRQRGAVAQDNVWSLNRLKPKSIQFTITLRKAENL